jgi:hypothetical protein
MTKAYQTIIERETERRLRPLPMPPDWIPFLRDGWSYPENTTYDLIGKLVTRERERDYAATTGL